MKCQTIIRRAWANEGARRCQPFRKRFYGTSTIEQRRKQFIHKTIDHLREATNDPVWSLLPLLKEAGSTYSLTSTLRKAGVPFEEYRAWGPALRSTSLEDAVQTFPNDANGRPKPLPTWLLLHLLAEKVAAPSDASNPMVDLLMANLPTLPLHLKPPALIFSAAQLASQNIIVPLRAVVDQFQRLEHPISTPRFETASHSESTVLALPGDPSYEFYTNHFVQALTQVPAYSSLYYDYVTSTIDSLSINLSDPKLKLHSDTYSALWQAADSKDQGCILSIPLLAYLRTRTEAEHFEPTPEHREAFAKFWRGIHEKQTIKGAAKATKKNGRGPGRVTSALNRSVALTGYDSPPRRRGVKFYLEHCQRLRSQDTPIQRKFSEEVLDLLRMATEDTALQSTAVLKVFRALTGAPLTADADDEARLQPNLATYTLLLRALVLRKDLTRANMFWYFVYAATGLPLNTEILSMGTRIWTTSGHPDAAFQVLERVTPKLPGTTIPENAAAGSLLAPSSKPTVAFRQPVQLDVDLINEWMLSFRRINRPDAVFALWDEAYMLYGVLHNSRSLNIMLQSTRKALLINERSIGIQISNYLDLGRKRFGLSKKSTMNGSGFELVARTPEKRQAAAARMRSLVVNPKETKPRTYKGGLWRGLRPEDAARIIFLQIMFGMDLAMSTTTSTPPTQTLTPTPWADVPSPARSVRQNWDSGAGVVGLGVALPSLNMSRYEWDVTPESMYRWVPSPTAPGTLEPRAHYPHLSLDNSNFCDYLKLLALTGRTTEVALTMAWMRHLKVYPSEATLSIAMVLWGEVSVEGPVVQGLSNLGDTIGSTEQTIANETEAPKKRSRAAANAKLRTKNQDVAAMRRKAQSGDLLDEYERFVLWLEDWVGSQRVPQEPTLRKWRLVIKELRESDAKKEVYWSHEIGGPKHLE